MANTYIEALNSIFTDVSTKGRTSPDALTRNIGGDRDTQPYISGYFQVFFELPPLLFGKTTSTAKEWLHSTCESFTPPGYTINKVDTVGLGQVGASFPTSKVITRQFTLTFREYQNMPLLTILRTWAGLFDPILGVSPLKGKEFIPTNYKGKCYVALMKPTGADGQQVTADDIEDIYAFAGVFPTNVPEESITNNLTGNDSIQYSVTFSFDGAPINRFDADVEKTVLAMLNAKSYMKTYENFSSFLHGSKSYSPVQANEPERKPAE